MAEPKVVFYDWGLIDYRDAWDKQEALFKEMVDAKLLQREGKLIQPTANKLIFCEHPHVYTLGKSGNSNNLLLEPNQLDKINATFYHINRGGDITYHGPGQIVGYPIFDLEQFFTDIHRYLRTLEEAIIRTCNDFGIAAERYEGYTGVWIDAHKPSARKICAMGVRCSRWVTMHGFAFNVNTDLSYFKYIVPCGIEDKDVTSLSRELNQTIDINEVKQLLKNHLRKLFNFTFD